MGTPYAVTVDAQSLEDGSVTLRERDSRAQVRVAVAELPGRVQKALAYPRYPRAPTPASATTSG